MRKRSGQLHGIDCFFPNRQKGSVIERCMACPETGFNMDKDWKGTPESMRYVLEYFPFSDVDLFLDRHLNQLFLMEDGNHKLQRKRKIGNPDDHSLLGDKGYFPDEDKYKKYVSEIGESIEASFAHPWL